MKNYPQEFPLFALWALLIVACKVEGADECRSSTLQCYDCDSRVDPYCGDPFNRTLPQEIKPAIKRCTGCCLKITHVFPNKEWIQRTCTENIIINYFIVDHVCLIEGKRRGKMCFCEDDLCNSVPSVFSNSFSSFRNLIPFLVTQFMSFTVKFIIGLN